MARAYAILIVVLVAGAAAALNAGIVARGNHEGLALMLAAGYFVVKAGEAHDRIVEREAELRRRM